MSNIGDPFTTAVPPVSSPGPQFALDINDILTEVMSRLSVKVPASSINFNTNLGFVGSAITDVAYITLVNAAASPATQLTPANRITAFSGDLWYVSPSGAIQITTGASLNAAGIGGITGDYGGANPAQLRFDDANQRYDFFDNFGTNAWAIARTRSLQLAAGATSTVLATLSWVGNASNKTFTLPTAPPTSQQLPLWMDTSGNITPGHGTKTYSFSPFGGLGLSGTFLARSGGGAIGSPLYGVEKSSAPASTWIIPLNGLPLGLSVSSLTFRYSKVNAGSISVGFTKITGGTAVTAIAATNSTTAGVGLSLVLTPGVPEVIVANTFYSAEFGFSNAADNEVFEGVTLTTTLPA